MQPALSSAGMLATMIESPMFAGDSFTVNVYAHTGPSNYALVTWQLTLLYDASTAFGIQFSAWRSDEHQRVLDQILAGKPADEIVW